MSQTPNPNKNPTTIFPFLGWLVGICILHLEDNPWNGVCQINENDCWIWLYYNCNSAQPTGNEAYRKGVFNYNFTHKLVERQVPTQAFIGSDPCAQWSHSIHPHKYRILNAYACLISVIYIYIYIYILKTFENIKIN